jgi:hypothetical protein
MTTNNTANTAWGFWGTMGQQADAAWPLACAAIAKAVGESLEDVRDFLDSSHGRHFADGVKDRINGGASLQAAIEAATAQWMAWKIDRRTAKHYGIPAGTPYLTGFVVQLASQAA